MSGPQCDKTWGLHMKSSHISLMLLSMILSPVIHFPPVEISFSSSPFESLTNTAEKKDNIQWKAVEEPIFFFFFFFLTFPLEEQCTVIFHTSHQLLFTRLFPAHLVKLNLQSLYKACPDPPKHSGSLYWKLTWPPILTPLRAYNLLNS